MYNDYFKLTRSPFEISPDPRFLFPTKVHNEALAGLYYGVKGRKGCMVLTGEVGTGKTLIVRCLIELLKSQGNVEYAYVFNTSLASDDFLGYVVWDLGLTVKPGSKADLLIQLNSFLIQRYRQGALTALVVDEAQNLSDGVLEEIRMLTNLEKPEGKLLQIILVGQPELDSRLESYSLRQIKQRITFRTHLEPLSEPLTEAYVVRRLRQAGDRTGTIFSAPALKRVYEYSRGIPRLINVICDNCLISAYALCQSRVTSAIVDEVARDMRLLSDNGSKNRSDSAITETQNRQTAVSDRVGDAITDSKKPSP